MKVLEITGEPILHGGQERFISNLIENYNYDDTVIDVLSPYNVDNNTFCELVSSRGGKVYNLGFDFRPGQSRREIVKPLRAFLSNGNYSVVHVHSGSISVLAYSAYAAKRSGVKKVLVHSHSTGIQNLKHKAVKVAFGGMLKHNTDHFLACSREAGLAKYPASVIRKQLTVIKNGVKISDYLVDPDERKSVREELGLSESDFVIGHVGRFSEEKNHKYLIDVFREIKSRCKSAKLLLVGDGETFDEVKKYSSDLKDDIVFTGNVDNVQKYYMAMDIFVLPSIHEGLPFVLVEAQAAGLPCIMSTGVSEEAVIGANVHRISLDDRNKWIDLILKFREVGFSDNTKAITDAGYDIQTTVSQIRNLYNDRME